jgi:hypothetical protein
MNPSFEHPYGLEHWITSPLADGLVNVVDEPGYPDNYAQGGTPHSVELTPVEGPGFPNPSPLAAGAGALARARYAATAPRTNAAVSQRLRVCPGTAYQLAFRFQWSGAARAEGEGADAGFDAGAECELYYGLADGDRSASRWADLNPMERSWAQVTITIVTPKDVRWVYLTLGVTCPAMGQLVGRAHIDSLYFTLAGQ